MIESHRISRCIVAVHGSLAQAKEKGLIMSKRVSADLYFDSSVLSEDPLPKCVLSLEFDLTGKDEPVANREAMPGHHWASPPQELSNQSQPTPTATCRQLEWHYNGPHLHSDVGPIRYGVRDICHTYKGTDRYAVNVNGVQVSTDLLTLGDAKAVAQKHADELFSALLAPR